MGSKRARLPFYSISISNPSLIHNLTFLFLPPPLQVRTPRRWIKVATSVYISVSCYDISISPHQCLTPYSFPTPPQVRTPLHWTRVARSTPASTSFRSGTSTRKSRWGARSERRWTSTGPVVEICCGRCFAASVRLCRKGMNVLRVSMQKRWPGNSGAECRTVFGEYVLYPAPVSMMKCKCINTCMNNMMILF